MKEGSLQFELRKHRRQDLAIDVVEEIDGQEQGESQPGSRSDLRRAGTSGRGDGHEPSVATSCQLVAETDYVTFAVLGIGRVANLCKRGSPSRCQTSLRALP